MFQSPFNTNKKEERPPMPGWPEHVRRLPLVCGLKTFNSELTIYACLQQAAHQFDFVLITDDGSTDRTLELIQKFCKDYSAPNVGFADVSSIDPWPDQIIEQREGDHHIPRKGNKTHAKAQCKNYQFVKNNFPNCIYVSLEDDVILSDNVRSRIYNRLTKWSEPETDCEFFNITSVIDLEHTIEALHNYEPGVPIPGMNFRKLYDNAGDYTLAAWWTGGKIEVGPDPNYPFGACLFPWLEKNQCGKKGQCDDLPFGFHFMNYRASKDGHVYDDRLKVGIKRFDELNDPDVNTSVFERVWFPKKMYLDRSEDIWYQRLEKNAGE